MFLTMDILIHWTMIKVEENIKSSQLFYCIKYVFKEIFLIWLNNMCRCMHSYIGVYK